MRETWKRMLSLLLAIVMVVGMVPQVALRAEAATTLTYAPNVNIGLSYEVNHNVLGCKDTTGGWSVNGETISATIKGYKGLVSSYTCKTVLTIKNNWDRDATLKFSYSLSNGGSVSGLISGTSGTYENTLTAGASKTITVESAKGNTTTTLTITGLTMYDPNAGNLTTTFKPVASGGSYTVDTVAVSAEMEKSNAAGTEYALVASPASGYKFMGWYDEATGEFVSYANNFTYTPAANSTIIPQFIATAITIWDVGGKRFTDLNEANTYASSVSTKVIALVSNGILPAGNYTISAGNTMLIPFDGANTLYTTSPGFVDVGTGAHVTPRKYRVLTMAAGANITVNGAISVGAKHHTTNGSKVWGNSPYGDCGFIEMASGSHISVENGGTLYAWGFVTGNGTVGVKSGGSVYEYFQMAEFRGGDVTAQMAKKNKEPAKIFPFSQYYVQNVEVETEYAQGAALWVYATIVISGQSMGMPIKFVGSDGGMFVPGNNATVKKKYLPDEDRLYLEVDGEFSLKTLVLNFPSDLKIQAALTAIQMPQPVSSAEYVLPLTNNMTINVLGGTTKIAQDIVLLPGAEVIVGEKATLQLEAGYAAYIYDREEWMAGTYVHDRKHFVPVIYTPTRTKTRTDADLVDAKIEVNGSLIVEGSLFTSASGANIMGGGTGTVTLFADAPEATVTYETADNYSTVSEIVVNPAWLKNGSTCAVPYEYTAGSKNPSIFLWSETMDRWVKKQDVTVTYNVNNDSGTANKTQTVTADNIVNGITLLGEGTFTSDTHKLTGWNTVAAPTMENPGVPYALGQPNVLFDGQPATMTLYAVWKALNTATFEMDGAVVTSATKYAEAGASIADPGLDTTKVGYTFDGWYVGDAKVTFPYTMPEGGVNFVAKWTAIDYSITYANTGDKSMPKVEGLHYGGEVPVPETPTLTGHTFKGWSIKGDTTNKAYDAEELKVSRMPAESLTYTANWEANTYTITLDADGGTGSPVSITQAYGTAISEPTAPTKQGYTFLGWYNGDTKVDFTNLTMPVVPDEGLTFKAKWGAGAATYTVKIYEMNTSGDAYGLKNSWPEDSTTGEKVSYEPAEVEGFVIDAERSNYTDVEVKSDNSTELMVYYKRLKYNLVLKEEGQDDRTIPYCYGASVEDPGDVSKDNYEFLGWTNEQGAYVEFPFSMPAANMTLTAQFKALNANYTIETYTMGTDGSYSNTPDTTDSTNSAAINSTVTISAPTAAEGFALDNTKSVLSGTVAADGSTVLKIYYSRNRYKLYTKADADAEKVEVKDGTHYYEATVTAPEDLADTESHTFEGWTIAGESGKVYTAAELTADGMPAENLIYTATWQIKSYTITWVDEDGTTELYSATVNHGDMPEYKGNEPTKAATDGETYKFTGWTPEMTKATGPATYKAVYAATTNLYTVTWKNEDGTVLETDENVAHGSTPEYNGETPTKEGNAQYTYTFKEWSPAVGAVTGDTEYTATFNSSVNTYTITWVDYNGDLLEKDENVKYGATPTFDRSNPTREQTDEFTYEFDGWDLVTWNEAEQKWVGDGAEETSFAVNGDQTYMALYAATKRTYSVTYYDEDKNEIASETGVPYGTVPQITVADQVKTDTAEFDYTFNGWDLVTNTETMTGDGVPETVFTVTGNMVYVPLFTETTRTYTVIWQNDDGTELEKDENVPYGTAPSYNGTGPSKQGDAQHSYTFAGWTNKPEKVTGDVTIKASYTRSVNQYTICFLDEDGKELDKQTVDYGTAVTYAGSTPAKASSESQVFAFAGWDTNDDGEADINEKDSVEVKSDLIYTAVFSESAREYTIKFVGFNADGTEKVLDTQKVAYGTSVTYSCDTPTKASTESTEYTFSGWDTDSDGDADVTTEKVSVEVKSDLTYRAVFAESARKYTIKFVNVAADGTEVELHSSEVAYGEVPVYKGETPTKEATAQYSYTFKGWDAPNENGEYGGETDIAKDAEIPEVNGAVTYKAVFTPVTRSYTITWLNEDGTEIEKQTLAFGTQTPWAAQTKAPDAAYTYTFAGWNKADENGEYDEIIDILPEAAAFEVTGDATYKAVFTGKLNQYTVTFLNAAGTSAFTTTRDYGEKIQDSPAQEKQQDAQYTYTFEGWKLAKQEDDGWVAVESAETIKNGEVVVTGNATYLPVFKGTLRSYTITWVVDGEETTETLMYGTKLNPANPTKNADKQYTYTFKEWTPAIAEVTGDAKYTAVFDQTLNKYTVTWIIDGEETKVEYEYGATPTHENPVKESTATTDYTFRNWNPEIAMVESDATYTAEFTGTAREYTVIWNVDDKKTTEQVANGVAIPQPADPVKEHYTFAGWTPAVPDAMPTEDVTFTATWTPVEYTIQWDTDGNGTAEENETQKLAYNTSHDAKTGRRETNSKYSYTFIGWDANSDKTVDVTPGAKITVKGDATYTALFSETPVEHTITINANGGTCTTTAIKQGYSTAVAEPAISREGYTFAGWYKDESKVEFPVTMPDYDMTLKAEWTAIEYIITFHAQDSLGSSKTQTVAYDADTTLDANTFKRDGYTFAGWATAENSKDVAYEDNAAFKYTTAGNTELYAVWTADTYKVFFNPNFETEEPAVEKSVEFGKWINIDLDAAPFSREGYTLLGWARDKDSKTADFADESIYTQTDASDVALYAVWQINAYDIKFVHEDGTEIDTITQNYGTEVKEPEAPTKTGHTFDKWLDKGGNEVTFPFNMPADNVTLTASWTVNNYKVKFVDDDGNIIQQNGQDEVSLSYGSMITAPADPEKKATIEWIYTFEGWDADGDGEVDETLTVAARDMTIMAVYSKVGVEYTIYWDIDGDDIPDKVDPTYSTVRFGDTVETPEPAEIEGYQFDGWGGTVPEKMPANDLMFKAQYKIKEYTVTFVTDGGTEIAAQSLIYGDAIVMPDAPEKENHTFNGWTITGESGKVYSEMPTTMPAENLTFTAKWLVNQATFIFYNGDAIYHQYQVKDGDTVDRILPAQPPVQEGYTFQYWKNESGEEVKFDETLDLKVGQKLYAEWKANEYKVAFHANNGTDAVTNQTVTYDVAVALNTNTFVREGHTFAGWAAAADSTEVVYADQAEYKHTSVADADLYAVWTVNSYKVTWNVDRDTTEETYAYGAAIVAPEAPTKEGYTFEKWTDAAGNAWAENTTMPADNVTYTAQWTANKHTLTFDANGGSFGDGKTQATVTGDYASAVNAPADPTREGHRFAGWIPEVPGTMPDADVTYTAQWDVNEHTVTWMADGRKISQDSVQYGTEFNASVTPGKEGHTFVGWTDEDGNDVTFPVTMGDADRTFHAKFTANSYTVTWMADGSKVDEKTYEYGANVPAPADPEKTGYKFVGWDVEVPATMPAENLTVNAVFTIKQYTVTLMDGDKAVETITADFGSEVTLPTLTKAGYEFVCWVDQDGNTVTSPVTVPVDGMTVIAKWTPMNRLYVVRSYVMGVDGKYPNAPTSTVAEFAPTGTEITAQFETMTGFTADTTNANSVVSGEIPADGTLILNLYYSRNQYTLTTNVDNVKTVDTYYFEAPVAAPTKPTKEGYTCTGWGGEIPATMPAENLSFTAKWDINSHTVTWVLGNGEEDIVDTYKYSETISKPADPEREGHDFTGWSTDYNGTKMPDKDLVSTAQWAAKTYVLQWHIEGSITTSYPKFGDKITAQSVTPKAGYKFIGWAEAADSNAVIQLPETMPAKDLELWAVFEPNPHTITWIVDGAETVVDTAYGETIDVPAPEKEGHTFAGWGADIPATMPDKDLTYTAQWTVNTHTVTWMVDNTAVKTEEYAYGAEVVNPATAEKEGYKFIGWDTTLESMPDKDVTINGLFTINQYTITFETGEGSAVEAITQNYNTYIRKPANPTREGYTFNGWLKDGEAAQIPSYMPAESYTLTADWTVNTYKITWNVDGVKTVKEIPYGSSVADYAIADPAKEGYTFTGWSAEVPEIMPAQNLTLVAEWSINTHTVTWNVDGAETKVDYAYGATISKPAAPTKTGYTFIGWDAEVPATMPDSDLIFTAQWETNSHTVTWKQGNGEANVVQTYKYGETIAKPADPEKEGHRFDGWTPGVATTMPDEDLTYTAKWTANSYSLTWKVDGKTEMGRQVYGTAITKKADPVKEGYTFAGWAREDAPDTVITVPATMPAEDLVLVAVWTTNKHTVTWNVDGKLEKETYAFGETPVHADPEKEGWTFTGWTPKVTAMGDADVTYTAAWAINEYTITWNLNNGTEATQTKVTYGDVITAQTPVKEGYKFMGWTVAGAEAYETAPKKMPAEDLTYTANWAVSSYTVTWNVDGKLTKETYAYGDTINVPADPEKAGYVFDSWAPAVPAVMPAENMTFTAVWENDQYTVTWIVDETQTTVEYAYGDSIVKPADPVKEGWTFGGWKVTSGSTSYIPNTMPAENLEITAQWTQNKHTVTWDVDGKTTAKTYLYGETVTVPADPEKVGYTFSGWTPTVSQTMGDADVTYTATWTVKSHTITWNVDGRTTEDTYNYGDTIQARTANKAYHIFAGWMNADGAIVEVPATMPDENLIFTVKWDPYDYIITFHANNGTDEKAEQTVEHNVAEKLDANPFTYEGYGFKGWATDKDSTETPYKDTDTIRVTTDMSLYAVWEEGQYTITWNVDGTETTSSCKYGTNIVLPATPTKTGYTFAGWLDEDGNKVTASTKMPAMDLTLTASWNVNYYDITWDTDGDGDVDDTISVAYGQMPVHADGSRPSGAQFDYTFTGWSPELAAVTGNAAYKAQFTAAVRAYTVTFVTNADGIPVNPVTAQYGDSITLRTLTREGYTFKGWSVNPVASEGAFGSYKITGETTLYAIWSANTYQISFVNEFGDTLTYKQYYGTPVELPEEPVQEGHTFNGWVNKKNPEVQIPETMPAEHLTFVADWTINQYTITFANTGDSKMDPITADYAAAIVIPADPKREGYTFTGWDIVIPETMPAKNLTITAKWERNVYTILWDVNGDGSVDPFEMEVAEQVEHGRWPLEQVGRKAPDAQYTYIFTGWTPEVKEATQDQVYVAQFTTSVNKYTIGWDFNGDGEAEDTTTVSYGAMPAYDAVKKKSDEKYTYTFTGWSPELTEVTGDTMYTAQFEATPVEYTVNFLLDQTGGIYQTVTAGYGTAIAVPENPEKTGYTFIGWDKEIPATMPVGGATLTGLWTINSYTITFDSDGGTEVASIKARFGGAVTAPAAPTRTGYTFAGWQPAVPATMPAENMTLKAQWTPNQYTITFGSNGGSQVEAITQAYGSAVTAPEAPVREGYTFAGWDQDVPATMPAENITLTAQWTPNSYDVRFYTDDSMTELHATVSADCDASFQLPAEPTRAGYNFGGWYWMDQEGNEVAVPTIMPAGGMDVYAKWDIDSFTISFNTDGGSVVESITAEYGAEIFAPADPEKEGYSFDGWDVEFPATMPAQSMTLNAVWKINQYTIRFNTDGGSEIASITQDYNTAVTAPAENPTKAGYTFLGWDAAIPTVMPAWDVTISAQWTPNQYTITFNTNGGSAIDTILADFGSALTEPAAPVKTGYVFAGWDVEFPATMPLDGLTLNAQWAAIDYAIYWDTDGDGEVDDTTNVAYDTMPEHADGAKPATAEFSYVFAGWDPEISLVRGTATYSALFSSVPNTYTITFDTVGGSELEPVTYAYGSAVAEPAAPTKEGYIFTGWDALPATMPAENIVVAAQWRVVDYSITFDSAGGTEVAPVTAGYLTTIAAPNDPTREGYTFTGWTPAFPEIMPLNGMKLTATWAINQYTITFNTDGGSEIAPITQDYGTAITAPAAPVKEGYTFTGWNAEIPATMPAANMTFTAQWEYTYSGWLTDEIGTTYLIDGEKAYYAQWANIDGNDYYFDSEGYIVKGLYQTWSMDDTYEATFVFDKETGVFLKDLTTVYADGEDLYYVENGEVINYPGLVRIVKDDGEINYYYFGADNKVVKDGTYTVTQNNGLLPVDPYIFGADGVIEHHEDTSRNGIHEENGKKYFYIDGVKVHMGLVEVDGEYYYAANGGELICGRTYWITRTNDLLPEKAYTFDEEGKIVFETEEPEEPEDPTDPTDPTDPSEPEEPVKPVKNGIYAEDGSLFYYENDERTYGGLLEINGYFYYAKINGEVIHGRSFWITKTNGLMEEGNYAFDNQGRMILAQEPEGPTDPSEPENPTEPEEPTEPLKNGIYDEDGSLYYYEDGVRTYAGLIEIDGYYYYVRTSGEVVHGRSYWITKTNGILPEKSYTFDDQGRMIDAAPSQKDPGKNGIYEEDGSLYYYEDGLRTYGGLMEIDGDYYYAKTDGEVVNSRKYWITKTNGLKPETSYNFDSKGRMIIQEEPVVPLKNGIYAEDGSLYYYEDGERTYAGLIVIDGYYYYIKTNCEAVHDCTYWITKTNDLLPAMNYTFDEQGRIQDVRPGDFDTTKNGIYKENGTLYYYVDGYKTNAGLIQIDGAYYYAKSDGAIVTGRKYYVAKTNGLMASGYYTFDAEGKMVQ